MYSVGAWLRSPVMNLRESNALYAYSFTKTAEKPAGGVSVSSPPRTGNPLTVCFTTTQQTVAIHGYEAGHDNRTSFSSRHCYCRVVPFSSDRRYAIPD